MSTQNKWNLIKTWNVGTPEGTSEKYSLYENNSGDFKIENDFGNISIEMERMSGYEFLKKLSREVIDILDEELGNSNGYDPDYTDYADCDQSSYGYTKN
jgi:hypothetical protein